MQHDHVLKSWVLTFWPEPQGGDGVCMQNISYPVAAFVILCNLIFNMTMFWKSWILTLWPKPQGQGMGWVGVCGHNISYRAALSVIPFNLICNMAVFWKSWILIFWPHPLSQSRGLDTGLRSKTTFDMFHNYYTFVSMQISAKDIDNWIIAKVKYLTFDLRGRGGAKF